MYNMPTVSNVELKTLTLSVQGYISKLSVIEWFLNLDLIDFLKYINYFAKHWFRWLGAGQMGV